MMQHTGEEEGRSCTVRLCMIHCVVCSLQQLGQPTGKQAVSRVCFVPITSVTPLLRVCCSALYCTAAAGLCC